MQAIDLKNIKSLKVAELISSARVAAQEEREAGIKLLGYIREIERRVLFAEWGYKSLLDFCVRELALSETSALRRIRSARLLAEVPEVEKKIEEGVLNVSHLAEVQSLFQQEQKETGKTRTKEEKKDILEKIEKTSLREAGKILNEIFASPDQDVAKPRKRDRIKNLDKVWREFSFLTDQDLVEKLEKIKGPTAHRKGNTWADVIAFMADLTLQKIDPMEKAERSEKRRKQKEEKAQKEEEQENRPSQQRQQEHYDEQLKMTNNLNGKK